MLVNYPKHHCATTIFTCENIRACRSRIQRMLVFVLCCSDALVFGEYSLSVLIMACTCLCSGHEEENSAKRRFANLLSIIMNPSESEGVVAMSFARVDFTSDVEIRDALSRSS